MLDLLFEQRFPEYFSKFREGALPWIFVHVPKTAGSSMTSELAQVLSPYKNIHVDYTDATRTFDEMMADAVRGFIEEAQSTRYAFASGHIRAAHVETIEAALGPSRLVSMLRHPVKRVVSDYLWQSSTGHPGNEAFRQRFPLFEDYVKVEGGRNKIVNHLVPRRIWTTSGAEECVDYILRRYAFVGLQEMYPLSFRMLFALLGTTRYPRMRVRVGQQEKKEMVDRATVALIEQLNELDMGVYAALLSRWKAIREPLIAYLNGLHQEATANEAAIARG